MPLNELTGIEKRNKKEKGEDRTEYFTRISNGIVKSMLKEFVRMRKRILVKFIEETDEERKEFVKNAIGSFEYNERDLEGLIQAKIEDENKSPMLGYYTGILLEMLTERNRKKGIETTVRIDGCGRDFPYLFMGARNFDNVYISNITGDKILSNSLDGGRGKTAVISGLKGDSAAYWMARKGMLDLLVINDSIGEFTAAGIAEGGCIKRVVLRNITSDTGLTLEFAKMNNGKIPELIYDAKPGMLSGIGDYITMKFGRVPRRRGSLECAAKMSGASVYDIEKYANEINSLFREKNATK
ncbi:MAG: hypothetical protein NTV63_04810 [Candidatus Woesearchaeota archaeon]|nr:hypothetical protein [Candidatus Woesearchaeota archaeon]